MSIIIDLKNAIRDAIYNKDSSIHFNFNKMQTTKFPYAFLYFSSYKIERVPDIEYWRKVDLSCVLEYMNNDVNTQAELWEEQETLLSAISTFDFLDTRINGRNFEFRTVDDVLQITFDLTFYIKEEDTGELMEDLDFSYKEIK